MSKFSLQGLGIALVTPFRPDHSVDFNALGNLIDFLLAADADYFVALGTTGESVTLTADERAEVRQYITSRIAGRKPVMLGIGGNCTRSVIEEIDATDLSAYCAILSVVPFYNKPSQEGIYQHYMKIADASPVPVVLYNVPGRTSVNMTAETTLRLAAGHKNILGIKEASGNMEQIEEIIRHKPDGFHLVSGDDSLALPIISKGGDGVISVLGNVCPGSFGRLIKAAISGNSEMADSLQLQFKDMFKLLFAEGNPAGIKSALSSKGLICNVLRLPLTPVTSNLSDLIDRAMSKLPDD